MDGGIIIVKHSYQEPEATIIAFKLTEDLLLPSEVPSEPETIPEWGGGDIDDLD